MSDGTAEAGTTPLSENSETVAPVVEHLSIDDLLGITSEVDPLFTDDAQHKGIKPLHEWLPHLPQDVRANLANLRAIHTKGQQELARERARVQELERSVQAERAALYSGQFAEKVKSLASDTEQYDVFDPEGQKKEMQRQQALMFQEMLTPIQEELQVAKRRQEMTDFKAQHPDLVSDPDIKMATATLLKERQELRLEDAYHIARSKVLATRQGQQAHQVQTQRQESRNGLSRTSTGTGASPQTPKFKDAVQAFEYAKTQKANSGR